MLVMFGVGLGSLGWMLVLGALTAIEKNTRWGHRIGRPLGVALLLAGLAVLNG
jgi:predicted metal-binding membrane protein